MKYVDKYIISVKVILCLPNISVSCYMLYPSLDTIFSNMLFQVSWVRLRDQHILAVDRLTYISDDRFYILKPESKNAWTLRIR